MFKKLRPRKSARRWLGSQTELELERHFGEQPEWRGPLGRSHRQQGSAPASAPTPASSQFSPRHGNCGLCLAYHRTLCADPLP